MAREQKVQEKINAIVQLTFAYYFNEEDYSSAKRGFISEMIEKKFDAFNIRVTVPAVICDIITICTDGNPGLSQIILKDILLNVPNLKKGYKLTFDDFTRVYTSKYPLVDYDDVRKDLEAKWDAQKSNGTNLVDTREYWAEIFKN